MKLDYIANLLAEKINQAHYIKHYLNNVFLYGFQKGAENSEKFTIEFTRWVRTNAYDTGEKWYYQEDNETYTTEELLEIYKKQLE